MKHASIVSALKRIGAEIQSSERKRRDDNVVYEYAFWAIHNGKSIEWYKQVENDFAGGLYVKRAAAKDDLHTDFFAGWWPRTIKAAIDYLTSK